MAFYRKQHQLSQQDVANLLGISRQAYAYYETEQREIRNEYLLRLSAYYGISVDALLGRPAAPADDDAIKFALFGTQEEITDAMLEDVKRYAQFIKENHRKHDTNDP